MTNAWMREIVISGMQGLIALRLDGAPPADSLPATVTAWLRVLETRPIAWDETLDAPRMCAAFREVAATCVRWPAPAHFLQCLPPRKQQLSLPAPIAPTSEATKKILRDLVEKMKATK